MFCCCVLVTQRLEVCRRAGGGLGDLQRVPVNLSISLLKRHRAKIDLGNRRKKISYVHTRLWGKRAKTKKE